MTEPTEHLFNLNRTEFIRIAEKTLVCVTFSERIANSIETSTDVVN